MSDPAGEKEPKAPDVLAASVQPLHEPHATGTDSDSVFKGKESDSDKIERVHDSDGDADDDDGDAANDRQRPALNTIKSYATGTSAATRTSTLGVTEQRPWYRNLNPLKWGDAPPLPEERMVSREYNAGFFSKLTFEWMSPLMTVSGTFSRSSTTRSPAARQCGVSYRKLTNSDIDRLQASASPEGYMEGQSGQGRRPFDRPGQGQLSEAS